MQERAQRRHELLRGGVIDGVPKAGENTELAPRQSADDLFRPALGDERIVSASHDERRSGDERKPVLDAVLHGHSYGEADGRIPAFT